MKKFREFATHARSKSENIEPALAESEARARQAGTTEEVFRGEETANTVRHTVTDAGAQSEDQSSVPPAVAMTKKSNRRGRPRKEHTVSQELASRSLNKVVKEAKKNLRANAADFLAKRETIIRRVGEAFEKKLPETSDVCEAIKDALAEEIRQKIISARTIETHCLDKWKKKTKPKKTQKNAESSFFQSKAIAVEQVKDAHEVARKVGFTEQQIYKITKDKFAAVKEAMDGSNNECYLRFNEKYELESIETDQSQPAEPTVRE